MSSNSAKRGFRSLWVDPFRQVTFGLYMVGLSLVFTAAASYLIWTAFQEQYQQLIEIFQVVDPNDLWEIQLNDVFYRNALRIGICLGLFLLSSFYAAFYLTHRYYGPLIATERFIGELRRGRYGARMSVRKRDELQLLAQQLNHLAAELQERHGADVTEEGESGGESAS